MSTYPLNAKPLMELRRKRQRPAEMVVIGVDFFPKWEGNPVLIVPAGMPLKDLELRYLVGLEVLLLVTPETDAERLIVLADAVLQARPAYLGATNVETHEGITLLDGARQCKSWELPEVTAVWGISA